MAETLDYTQNSTFRDRSVLNAWAYINPGKTPFLTLAPKNVSTSEGGVKVRKLELPMMLRRAPRNTPIPDGADVTSTDYENIEDRKKMAVTTWQTARIATKVGQIASVLGAQVPNIPANGLLRQNIEAFMVDLRRDVEKVCLDTTDLNFETAANDPNRTRGAGSWINATAQAEEPVPADFLTPTGSIVSGKATRTAITEDELGDILESIYEANEEPAELDMFCRLGVKRQMADWTKTGTSSTTTMPIRSFNQDAEDKRITHTVSLYEGEGIVRVHPHFNLPAGTGATYVWAYLFNMEFWQVHMLNSPKFTPHPNLGGGPRGHMEQTFFNVCRNPRKHGKITK